jgi:hypothetical protein
MRFMQYRASGAWKRTGTTQNLILSAIRYYYSLLKAPLNKPQTRLPEKQFCAGLYVGALCKTVFLAACIFKGTSPVRTPVKNLFFLFYYLTCYPGFGTHTTIKFSLPYFFWGYAPCYDCGWVGCFCFCFCFCEETGQRSTARFLPDGWTVGTLARLNPLPVKRQFT